jgi:hypothetical protein
MVWFGGIVTDSLFLKSMAPTAVGSITLATIIIFVTYTTTLLVVKEYAVEKYALC